MFKYKKILKHEKIHLREWWDTVKLDEKAGVYDVHIVVVAAIAVAIAFAVLMSGVVV